MSKCVIQTWKEAIAIKCILLSERSQSEKGYTDCKTPILWEFRKCNKDNKKVNGWWDSMGGW
jgi:hypothetical protein